MRIIQFTDIHVGEENERLHGVDVRANFVKVLQSISQEASDLVVLSGDLCAREASEGIYQWIRENILIYSLDKNLVVIPGNHDDSVMLSRIFEYDNNLYNNELYYDISSNTIDIIFLDTSAGICSTRQKVWLENKIKNGHKRIVIFMHHPPYYCGVRYMDEHHALGDMSDFQTIFNRYSNRSINIFCGHYHVEKTLIFDHVSLFITPSCFVQIDQDAPFFKPDHYMIGYRLINITPEGHIRTTVKYIM